MFKTQLRFSKSDAIAATGNIDIYKRQEKALQEINTYTIIYTYIKVILTLTIRLVISKSFAAD